MCLFTAKKISQKAQLSPHFLQHKQSEFEELRSEIARLCAELAQLQSRHLYINATARQDHSKARDSSTGPTRMRKRANGLRIIADKENDVRLTLCVETITATEFGALVEKPRIEHWQT